MFLKQRATQAEYFDAPNRTEAEIASSYRQLARINRFFLFAEPFQRFLPRSLGNEQCRSLSILDLGAGDGDLSTTLKDWAAKKGWNWKIVNLDINPSALKLSGSGAGVVGSVTSLPFLSESFDVVIATQMTHHLVTDLEVRRHFQEAWRVTRDLLLVCDLHRNVGLYAILYLVLQSFGFSKEFSDDALLSVKRGWRLPEWRRLAEQAGIPQAKVHLYFGARICLQARKTVQKCSVTSAAASSHFAAASVG